MMIKIDKSLFMEPMLLLKFHHTCHLHHHMMTSGHLEFKILKFLRLMDSIQLGWE